MKRQKLALFVLMLVFAACPHEAEAAKKHHHAHHPKHHHVAAGVDRGAGYSDIVIEADTGRIVHATDSDSLRHPASLTKMMTMYITFQALESGRLALDQLLPVSENASYQSPSKLGLRAGHSIRVQDAILGVVTESANDAAVVLGESLGGSEEGFAAMMTKQAHALGMTKTLFRNPSGLPDPEQVTTAHDMAVLGAAFGGIVAGHGMELGVTRSRKPINNTGFKRGFGADKGMRDPGFSCKCQDPGEIRLFCDTDLFCQAGDTGVLFCHHRIDRGLAVAGERRCYGMFPSSTTNNEDLHHPSHGFFLLKMVYAR